jgi:hypothetical protein
MFFKKKVSEAPPIENEHEYICWFIEHSPKVAHIRKLYKKNIDGFVAACAKGAEKVLAENPTGGDLFDRVGELSEAYETSMKPLVEKRGGLEFCPPELQGAVVGVLMNVFIGIEFLKYKHKHQEAIDLFAAVG